MGIEISIQTKLTLIKTVHTAIWIFFNVVLFGSISSFSVENQVLYNQGSSQTYGVCGHDPSRKSAA